MGMETQRVLKPLFCLYGAVTVGLPPAWVDVSEEIAVNVQRVRTKIAELAKALMPSFEDGREDDRRIEALTQEIIDLLKKPEKRLQRLSGDGPSKDSNVKKYVQCNVCSCSFCAMGLS